MLSHLRGHRGRAGDTSVFHQVGLQQPGKGQVVVPVLQAGPEEGDRRRNVSEMLFIEPTDYAPAQMRCSGSLAGVTSTENLPQSHLSITGMGWQGGIFLHLTVLRVPAHCEHG